MPENIVEILYKHARQEALNSEEQQQLDKWLLVNGEEDAILQPGPDEAALAEYLRLRSDEAGMQQALQRFRSAAFAGKAAKVLPLRRWGWVAAAAMLLLAMGLFLWPRNQPATQVAAETPDIAPGMQGAVLTLGDGSQVVLDSLDNGVVATQSGTQAVLKNGLLAYETTGKSEAVYNTMNVPKGRQFRLTLPDGTQVWLNAASSIRYPTVFSRSERRVEITGEVYFEVAKNERLPFKVQLAGRTEITVLGTSFNVNAYANESAVEATLLEGSIRVSNGSGSSVLRPGEQARIAKGISIEKHPDVQQVMAWKNGYFNFEDMKIDEVMRQLERWYNIEVVYENGVPDIRLSGKMTRSITLKGVLLGLSELGLHYRLEGEKLTVMP